MRDNGARTLALCLTLLLLAGAGAQAVTIDWVTVGDATNAPDSTGYGAVPYEYRISQCEVTNGQYREFLNAVAAVGYKKGLYYTTMAGTYGGISRSGSGTVADPYVYSAKGGDTNWDSRPVNYVSFWDAARFANWMHNGQGDGDTESGAYTELTSTDTFLNTVTREPGALFFIPTENEWYKSAYYKSGGLDAGYWRYPTQSNTSPTCQAPPGGSNSANYWGGYYAVGSPYWTAEVGAYTGSVGPYGTFDKGGNLWEWNEAVINVSSRGFRGGAYNYGAGGLYATTNRLYGGPSMSADYMGFRLAAPLENAAIPEPATVGLFGIAVAALLRRSRRRA